MSLWTKLRGRILPGSRPSAPDLQVLRFGTAPPRRDTQALGRAYEEVPGYRSILDKVAGAAASVCWRVYVPATARDGGDVLAAELAKRMGGSVAKPPRVRRLARAQRHAALRAYVEQSEFEELKEHAALDLLESPSPVMTGHELAWLVQALKDGAGEAFLLKQRDAGGTVVALWPVPPQFVITLPVQGDTTQARYRVAWNKLQRDVVPRDMIHLRGQRSLLDPHGRGLGVGAALGDEIAASEYAAQFVASYFFNNAMPGAIVGVEGMPSGDTPQAKAWKESLVQRHGGAKNAGSVLVTGGKVTIARMDTSFQQMGMVELQARMLSVMQVAMGGVPDGVLGMGEGGWTQARSDEHRFMKFCVDPRLDSTRSQLQLQLVDEEWPGAVLDYHGVIPQDDAQTLAVMTAFPYAFRVGEARALANKEPSDRDAEYLLTMPGQGPDAAPMGGGDANAEPAQIENSSGGHQQDPAWARNFKRRGG